MSQSDRAFERLQVANPYPVTEIERPTGQQFLAAVDAPTFEPVRTPSRRLVIAFTAAALVVLGALPIVLYGGGDQSRPASEAPSEFAPDVAPLPDPPTRNECINCFEEPLTGLYRIDQLGTQLTIELEDSWLLREGNDGFVSMVGPGQRGRLTFIRPTSLSDPVNPFTPITASSWPIDDIDGWLNQLHSGVTASNIVSVDIGGTATQRFDLTVDDGAPCISNSICAAFVTNRDVNTISLDTVDLHRVWWVATGGEAPLVIFADGDEAFLNTATATVDTIEFGPTQPHPIPAGDVWEYGFSVEIPAGPVRIPALGGIGFTLETLQYVEQSADHAELNTTTFAGVWISILVAGPDDQPIGSIDDVVDQMASQGITFTGAGDTGTALPGRVFDLVRGPAVSRTLSFTNDDPDRSWQVPAAARLWLFETERGVLMVSAGTQEGTFGLDEAIELGQSIVSTLTLIDPADLPN